MITKEERMKIQILHQQGVSQRSIAKELGISRNTVKRYLAKGTDTPAYAKREKRASKLEPYKSFLHSRIAQAKPVHLSAVVLFREIQELGYSGSLPVLIGRSRQINAQNMQLSEGASYLPQYLHNAPSDKYRVGRVSVWLSGVN